MSPRFASCMVWDCVSRDSCRASLAALLMVALSGAVARLGAEDAGVLVGVSGAALAATAEGWLGAAGGVLTAAAVAEGIAARLAEIGDNIAK